MGAYFAGSGGNRMGSKGLDLSDSEQGKWLAVVNTVMNLWVLQNAKTFSTS